MENKYYTPEINELHVGFECEYYGQVTTKLINDKAWRPVVVSDRTYIPGKVLNINSLHRRIKMGSIRVKYLDKEDIESFGFTFSHNGVGNSQHFKLGSIDFELRDNGFVIIQVNGYVFFHGRLKNKSETKRLLNQLGIIFT